MTWESKASWKNPSWKYTPASSTDISKTIARIKKEMKEESEQKVKLVQLKRKTG